MTIEELEKSDPVFLSPEMEKKVVDAYINRRISTERKIKRLERLLISMNVILLIIAAILVGKFFGIPGLLF